jgi:hypothetical protein
LKDEKLKNKEVLMKDISVVLGGVGLLLLLVLLPIRLKRGTPLWGLLVGIGIVTIVLNNIPF